MADLSKILPKNYNPNDYAMPNQYVTVGDPQEEFLNELSNLGYKKVKPPIVMGHLTKCQSPEDTKNHQQSGWFVYHELQDDIRTGSIGLGIYGSFKGEAQNTWCSKHVHHMTTDERRRFEVKREAAIAELEKAKAERNQQAKIDSQELWAKSEQNPTTHPYLTQKNIGSYGLRLNGQELLVPVYDKGELCNLQKVYPNGKKYFMTGGKKQGCYHAIGEETPTIYIAEGYSTAASIHEATDSLVYICFDAGNIYEVAALVKDTHKTARIIIAADNDSHLKINVGVTKAEQAASAIGVEYVIPDYDNDFNDMKPEDVTAQLLNRPDIYEEKVKVYDDIAAPQGILSDIVSYYNATSGNHQPAFAVQTALCIGSIICGRYFKTNKNNFASLWFLNIAKTATGKEHPKTVIEDILSAAKMDHLIGGDGYTSAGAVFSCLLEKPRHYTCIDEFGKYLAAMATGGNSAQFEANTCMMEGFGRASGIMRPKNYSTMTLGKEKQKELQTRFIIRPSLSLMAMTTPSTFFNAMDHGAITDGFLNRFIVCISDQPRELRQHKDSLDVPQRIIDWIDAINARKGNQLESANTLPDITEIPFTADAYDLQQEFQQFCLDKMDELEPMGLDGIAGRANEQAMRMALIYALARDPWTEAIEAEDMAWCAGYMKQALIKMIDVSKMNISSSDHEADKKEILQAIRQVGKKGIAKSLMLKRTPYSKHKRRDLQEILDALVEADLIFLDEVKAAGRGRPTQVYKGAK